MQAAEDPTGAAPPPPAPGAPAPRGFGASQGWRRTLGEVLVVLAGLALILLGLRGCSGYLATAITAQLPPSADEKIGKVGGEAMRAQYGVVGGEPPPEQRARAERIFEELRSSLTAEEARILVAPRLTVVSDPTVNAFALPGGEVFILTGLLEQTERDDSMLRGVVAHELGHAVRRHGVRGLVRRGVYGLSLALIFGGTDDIITTVVAGASQLGDLEHTRGMEEEADAFAVDLLRRGGHDVEGLARFLEALEAAPIPEILSTHPDSYRRAQTIRKLVLEAGK